MQIFSHVIYQITRHYIPDCKMYSKLQGLVKDFSPQKHVNIEQVNMKTFPFRRNLVQILAQLQVIQT